MEGYIKKDTLIKEASQDGAYGYIDIKQIEELPNEDVRENIKGKWIKHRYEWECSVCGRCELWMNASVYEYCPHCGSYNGDSLLEK